MYNDSFKMRLTLKYNLNEDAQRDVAAAMDGIQSSGR